MVEDVWDEMVEKYGIHGYDNSHVIINYRTLIELTEKAEKWDHLITSDPTTGSYINRRIMEEKLEAVKTQIKERISHQRWLVNSRREVTIPMRIMKDELKPLLKILEGKE